jgi:hypothetical protein
MPDNCPDCNAVPGAFHTPMCGARDGGAQIWVSTHHVPALQAQVSVLRDELDQALARIRDLEAQTPQAQRLQYEADLAAADLAETGYADDDYPCPVGTDRHGRFCQCPYCYDEPDSYDMPADDYGPGPEGDNQGGMSEIHVTIADGEESS